MNNLTMRRLTIDDYDEIIRIWSISGLTFKPLGRDSREFISNEIDRSHCAFFGLFNEVHMIGVGIANYDGRRGWINRVAVDPDCRGLGFAARLIEAGEEFLRERGAVVMCALIEDVNKPSMDCFKKSGYTSESNFIYFTKRDAPEA